MFFPMERSNFLNDRRCTFGRDFEPFLSRPVEDVDGVEAFLVGASAAKHDNSIVLAIVVHRAIGSAGRHVAGGFDFSPGHAYGIVGPDVVHVVGI